MASDGGVNEQVARRLTRALADDFLIDEWPNITGRAAHGVGRSVRTSSPVVVDVLLGETPQAERDAFRRQSERAASLAAKLTHPGILTVFGAGMIGDWPYAASMPIDGIRLDEMMQSGAALDATACARIIGDIAESLSHAHGEGIPHGRVAPNHIVLERASRAAFLADFGADGGSVAGDIGQLGRLGSTIASKANPPAWLTEVIEKASRANGYASAREVADDLAKRIPASAPQTTTASAGRDLILDPTYVLPRAAALHQQVVGGMVSSKKALDAFAAAGGPASLDALDEAAFEAGIEERFVKLAAAEQSTYRTGSSVLVTRIIDATLADVLRGRSKLTAPPINLSSPKMIGGAPDEGGIMVFQIPNGPAWKALAGTLGARTLLVSVMRASNGRDPRASDVVMSAAIDPSRAHGGGTTAAIGGGVGGAVLGGIAGAIFAGVGAAVVAAVVLAIIGGFAGAAVGRSGSASVLTSAKREIANAIDALSS